MDGLSGSLLAVACAQLVPKPNAQNARQNDEIRPAPRWPAIHRDIGVAIYPRTDGL
jgi:hypothetical protein